MKYQALLDLIKTYESCAVCFSGGMDSFLLLLAAKEALGKENVIALTMKTEFYPSEEIECTASAIKQIGVEHIIVSLSLLDQNENISKNDQNICYHCKYTMMERAVMECRYRGIPVLFEGSNASDISNHAPGIAACSELGIISPLKEVGITKPEIREILSKKGFFEIVRPPDSCLALRIMQDEPITLKKLKMTDTAEDFIKIFGYETLRVCNVSDKAIIELDKKDIQKFREQHLKMAEKKLLQLGYVSVEVSDSGYARNSMKKSINEDDEIPT